MAFSGRSNRVNRRCACQAIGLAILVTGIVSGQSADGSSLEKTSRRGPVSATIRLEPSEPVIGDVLKLRLTVVAEDRVEVLMPEFGEALGRFTIIDFVPREDIDDRGRTVLVQDYKLQAPPSGDHAIPPILVEFVDRRPGEKLAPEGMDAYELLTERINFHVQSVLVNDAAAGLNPPLGRIEPETKEEPEGSPWWMLAGIVLGSLAVGGGIAAVAARFRNRIVRRSAYEIARRKLDALISRPLPAMEEIDRFYVELTGIIRRYLENRFELRAPELTTEEFLAAVGDSAELTPEHKKLLNEFLSHADLVKFAGIRPSQEDIDETISRANRFLEETRENSPMLIDDESDRVGSEAAAGGVDE